MYICKAWKLQSSNSSKLTLTYWYLCNEQRPISLIKWKGMFSPSNDTRTYIITCAWKPLAIIFQPLHQHHSALTARNKKTSINIMTMPTLTKCKCLDEIVEGEVYISQLKANKWTWLKWRVWRHRSPSWLQQEAWLHFSTKGVKVYPPILWNTTCPWVGWFTKANALSWEACCGKMFIMFK